MKLIIAAAVAAFAMPAFAQDMPAPTPPAPQTAPMPPAPMPADAMAAPMAPPAVSDGNYPMCTRTIVDHCTERSNARGERLHSTPRKPN